MLDKAKEAARLGRYAEALKIAAVEGEQANPAKNVLELCFLYAWNAQNYSAALHYNERIGALYGNNTTTLGNKLSCLSRSGQHAKAAELGKSLLKNDAIRDKTNIYHTLASVAQKLGDNDSSIYYGELAILSLDAAAPKQPKMRLPPRKTFTPDSPERNIISFSLWGNHSRYLRGAVRNALLAPDIYPSWTCRFYVDDSVPQEIRELLAELGAQVVLMPRAEVSFIGLGWRFQVWDDKDVDFCLIRDCDSVITVFEAHAVSAWLASDAWFHIMRCWYTHTDLILAGMWGGATGALHNLYDTYKDTLQKSCITPVVDQEFLRSHAWPYVKHHALIHDRFHRLLGTVQFPNAELFPGDAWHIGINEAAGLPQRQERTLREYYSRVPSLQNKRTYTITLSPSSASQIKS